MKERLKENVSILKEIGKNIVMGNFLLKALRNKIASGRTTGALDVDTASRHSLDIFNQYQLGLEDAGLDPEYFKGKSILEIGPGSNLGVQLNFIARGATSAFALDRFPDVQSTEKEAAIYEKIFDHLNDNQKELLKDTYKTENNIPVFMGNKIQYFGNCSLEKALRKFSDEDGDIVTKFDVVVSHLALEHVANLNKGIYSVKKILNTGGICIFICNLKSLGGVYNHVNEPLRLLNYSEKLWRRMFSKRGGSNRVRAYGYRKRLEVNNFKILSFKILESMSAADLKKAKRHFNDRFASLTNEELSILKFRIVAKLGSEFY
jgi:SAM-dependent methyltransferase